MTQKMNNLALADLYGSCTITCMEPGCQNKIRYYPNDPAVPLYCATHRTEEGRHAQTKDTRPLSMREPTKPVPIKKVIVRCPRCKSRKTITEEDFHALAAPDCCGRRMWYHREAKEGE